ncbi:MAG: hypothetical protein ABIQ16_19375, partial [Polyangiaceae bacterium]
RALRAAREYATARGLGFVAAFGDTLSGDLARLQVLRRLRRSFPKVPPATLDDLIKELLTP